VWSSVVVCRDFEFFKVPRVCGPCVVVCGDFEFFQSSSVLGPCVVVCGDFVFSSPPVCEHLVNFMYSMKNVKKILEIFKGSAFPYRVENAFPWGGVYCKLPNL